LRSASLEEHFARPPRLTYGASGEGRGGENGKGKKTVQKTLIEWVYLSLF